MLCTKIMVDTHYGFLMKNSEIRFVFLQGKDKCIRPDRFKFLVTFFNGKQFFKTQRKVSEVKRNEKEIVLIPTQK